MEDDLKEILIRIKQGEEIAFRELYDIFKSKLYFFTLKFTKSQDFAEEIVQEVFIKIWESRLNLDENLSFKSFIFTVTRNSIINFLKKAANNEKLKKEMLSLSYLADWSDEEAPKYSEYEDLLHHAIAQLPPKRQEIFKLAKLQCLSYEEIAKQMGISKSTVRLQLIEANKFIKSFFHHHADEVFSALLLFYGVL